MTTASTIKRVSRFGNHPILNELGRPVIAQLTPRQTRLLSYLERNRYATFEDLHAYLGGDPTALRYTIRVLKAQPNCYIKVADQDRYEHNLRRKVRYELDRRGIEFLRSNGVLIPNRAYVRNFSHAALASHGTGSIEAGIAASGFARLITWAEILSSEHMPAATKQLPNAAALPIVYQVGEERFEKAVRADSAPFGIALTIDDRRKFRFFPGVEADCGTEPIRTSDFERTSIFSKFMAYLAIEADETYRHHFGFPSFLVPFLTTSETRMKSMMAELSRITAGRGSKTLMFSYARDDAAPGYLFSEPWQRVGFDPIVLASKRAAFLRLLSCLRPSDFCVLPC